MAWVLSGGDVTKREEILHRTPLRAVFAAFHCYLISLGVECVTARERGNRAREAEKTIRAVIAAAKKGGG